MSPLGSPPVHDSVELRNAVVSPLWGKGFDGRLGGLFIFSGDATGDVDDLQLRIMKDILMISRQVYNSLFISQARLMKFIWVDNS